MTPAARAAARLTPQVVLGLVIVGFGLLLTADNLGYADARHVIRYWPLILVAFGLAKLLQSDTTSGRVFGGLLIIAGGWTTAEEVFGVTLDIDRWWPLFLVGLGALIISRAFRGDRLSDLTNASSSADAAISEFAFWSGKVRRNASMRCCTRGGNWRGRNAGGCTPRQPHQVNDPVQGGDGRYFTLSAKLRRRARLPPTRLKKKALGASGSTRRRSRWPRLCRAAQRAHLQPNAVRRCPSATTSPSSRH